MAERMFDGDSFTEEITNASEAKASVNYLSHNEFKFKKELTEEGLGFDEIQAEVAKVWGSLLASCKRVKYSDNVTEAKSAQYTINKK